MKGNEIRFYGIKPSRSLQRQVERRIENWIRNKQGWLYYGKSWNYLVEIECDVSQHFYQCSIQVQTDAGEWFSQDAGKTLQDALSHSLKRLQTLSSNSSQERWGGGFGTPAFT